MQTRQPNLIGSNVAKTSHLLLGNSVGKSDGIAYINSYSYDDCESSYELASIRAI